MIRWMFILLITVPAFADTFPEADLRQAYGQLVVLKTISQLKNEFNIKPGDGFDSALALQQCDAVDKSLKHSAEENKKMFYAAKEAQKRGLANWDKDLRESMSFGGASQEGKPLSETVKKHTDEHWGCLSTTLSLCNEKTSMELLNNLAADPGLIDENVFSTCVRLIRSYRKAGTCTYSQDFADQACKDQKKTSITIPIDNSNLLNDQKTN